ncbi:MAG: RluA family pseudouridine synthase [Phycisphaeraceae bacterium]|nr:RluA family pseudouridine synthase [Phycisphaeraceae bacterium]
MTPDPSRPRDHADEQVSIGDDVILPGGKVDPEALRKIIEAQRAGEEGGDDDDAAVGRVTFTLQRDLNTRVDKYLTSRITFMSRNQLQKLIAGGGVIVNDRPAKPSTNLRRGDVIEVMIPEPPPAGIPPEDIPLEVLYEDEYIIVLNKQPDIIVHPARSHNKGTMINALAHHFRKTGSGALSNVGDEFARPGVVHRLDRNTSGVIVFAKQDEAHWKLGHQFEHRRVDKRYLALVQGRPEPDSDLIELPIGPHPSREKGYREKYVVRHDEAGKHAITIYRTREVYSSDAGTHLRSDSAKQSRRDAVTQSRSDTANSTVPSPLHPSASPSLRPFVAASLRHYALVELELKTGRTHQIRVHLSHLGWPIVGDDMYGGKPLFAADGRPIINRQALHAALLAFTHPISGKRMEFTAPLRGDMAEAVHVLRRAGPCTVLPAVGATVDLHQAVNPP